MTSHPYGLCEDHNHGGDMKAPVLLPALSEDECPSLALSSLQGLQGTQNKYEKQSRSRPVMKHRKLGRFMRIRGNFMGSNVTEEKLQGVDCVI